MKKILLFITIYFTSSYVFSQEYTVKVLNKEKIEVKARFILESNTISMLVNPIPQLPDGQASFVEDLEISDKGGKALHITNLGVGDWQVDGTIGTEVHLSYIIHVKHGDYDWPFGKEEVAYSTTDGMFFTGTSLFIVPSMKNDREIQVEFELPSDKWKVSTPWKLTEDSTNRYEVSELDHLLRNGLFIGTHEEKLIQIEDLTVKMVMSDTFGSAKDSLILWLDKGLQNISGMFGTTPGSSYLIIINPGNRTDGGAFVNSFSMVLNGQLNEAAANVWIHGITHEAFHLWNGIGMDGSNDVEWFTEGATDYMTIVHLSRAGLITEEVALKKIENSIRKELIARMLQGIKDPLSEAGKNKAQNRFLIYGGGAVAALLMDVELREATDNTHGLDELMRGLFIKFHDSNKLFTNEDIMVEAEKLSGKDFSQFFNTHIYGNQATDLNAYFNKIGIDYYSFIEEIYLIKAQEKNSTRLKMLGF